MACYFVLSKRTSATHNRDCMTDRTSTVYVNSFLATLNTRRVTRGRGTDAETATMPTFLMVGKITKHDPNQFADHVYPPSFAGARSKADGERSQRSNLEVGIEQEVTVTRDSVSTSPACFVLATLCGGLNQDSLRRSSLSKNTTTTVTRSPI